MLDDPKLANRSCAICLKYKFDERTGLLEFGADQKPQERMTGCGDIFLAPCRDMSLDIRGRRNRTCRKGTPENPKTLSEANQRCYEHYLECRAVGQFPDDPIVRRNAGIIRQIEDEFDRKQKTSFQKSITEVMELLTVT